MDFDSRFNSRLAVVEVLCDLSRLGKGTQDTDPLKAAEALDQAAADLRRDGNQTSDGVANDDDIVDELSLPTATSIAYDTYARLTAGIAHLVRWVNAVRSAELDADRYHRAARVAAADAKRQLANAPADLLLAAISQGLSAAADAISAVKEIDEVAAASESLLRTALPLPWTESPVRHRRRVRPRAALDLREADHVEPSPPVAFLTFWLNGVILANPQLIRPDVMYDLELRVQLSRWPREWDAIQFVPLHVEPSGTLDVPTFRFRAEDIARERGAESSADGPYTLHSRGRLRVHAPMDLLARPLEIQYVAMGIGMDSQPASPRRRSEDVTVQGQRRIALQSFDPALNPITGFRSIDARIHQLRDVARREGLPDDELKHFLTLLAAMGRISAEALVDDLYPGVWSETRFQDDVRSRLRATPTIGGELEEHPRASGGITDLSFHKIRLELKAQDDAAATVSDAVHRYGQQTAQYVVGSDRRAGVLSVLDTTHKTTAPHDAGGDLDIVVLALPSGHGRSILLGVVIVRGNLAMPSDLSRRSR